MAWTEELPSGRHRGVYRTADGRRKSAGTFSHKKMAQNAASAAEESAARPNWRDPKHAKQTWADWCEVWWATRSVEPSTMRSDLGRRDTHLMPKWATMPLGSITRHSVKEWAAELRNGGLAPATVHRVISLFSASLAAAVDAEILAANPAARLKLPMPSNQSEVYLSRQDAGTLLDELDGPDKALVAFLLGTGVRWGEGAGALVEQLDVERASYRVWRTWDDGARAIKEYPKNRRRRTVPVPAWVLELVEPLVDGRRSGFLFRTSDGTPFDYHNWRNRIWSHATVRAGVAPFNIHALRHTYASWLVQDGVPLEEVGRLLGHVSPLTTRRYAHLAEAPSAAVLAALGDPRTVILGSGIGANVGQTAALGGFAGLHSASPSAP
jgi:integrase